MKSNRATLTMCFAITVALGRVQPLLAAPAASQSDSPATTRPAQEVDLGDKVAIKLVEVPTGKFTMGSPKDEKDRSENEPQKQVTMAKPFWIGIHEVTQEQYKAVMANNPAHSKGVNKPVEGVSWDDANEFCRKASARTTKKFRLPTEAEWEYACRAGSKTRYYFGDDEKQFGDYAWFNGNSKGVSHSVGEKKPNAWGLYDTLGNVAEWCQDSYLGPLPKGAKEIKPGSLRVDRGGFFDFAPCRCATRQWCVPIGRNPYIGFRVVME